jgi:phosphoesterase RecJ-like protein
MGREEVKEAIKAHQRFLLTGHLNPDGDSIACQLAMAEALEQLGKEASLQSADPVPAMYRKLPGASRIRRVAEIEGEFEAAILMECPTPERSGFQTIPAGIIINIDHHPDNQNHADVNWVNPKRAATAEMIFTLVQELGCEITGSMAENLFAGILTDTGSFTFSNTTANALEAAAELMRRGANPAAVAQKVYRSYPPEKLDLIGRLLSGIKRFHDGSLVLMTISNEEIVKQGYANEIFEDIVNMPLITSPVRVSVIGREDESGRWRFSMRSKGDIDIGEVARRFGGGGHLNAAGFTYTGEIGPFTEELIAILGTVIESSAEQAPEV